MKTCLGHFTSVKWYKLIKWCKWLQAFSHQVSYLAALLRQGKKKKSSKLLMLWHVANLEKTACKSTMSYSWTDNLFQCINRCLVLNFSLALHIQNTTDQFWKYLREVPFFFFKNTFVSAIIQTKDMINAEFSYCTAAFTF